MEDGRRYLVATLDGREVAAITAITAAGSRWKTYVAVSDVDAAAARVRDGARRAREPVRPRPHGVVRRSGRCRLRPVGAAPHGRRRARERARRVELQRAEDRRCRRSNAVLRRGLRLGGGRGRHGRHARHDGSPAGLRRLPRAVRPGHPPTPRGLRRAARVQRVHRLDHAPRRRRDAALERNVHGRRHRCRRIGRARARWHHPGRAVRCAAGAQRGDRRPGGARSPRTPSTRADPTASRRGSAARHSPGAQGRRRPLRPLAGRQHPVPRHGRRPRRAR